MQNGLAFLPQTVFGSFMMLFATRWIARLLRPHRSLAAGMLLGIAGILVIFVGIHTNFLVIVCGEVLVGAIASFIVTPMTTVVLASVAKEYSGIASACLNTARQMGGVLSVAILGTVSSSQSLFPGVQISLFITAGVLLLGFFLSLSAG